MAVYRYLQDELQQVIAHLTAVLHFVSQIRAFQARQFLKRRGGQGVGESKQDRVAAIAEPLR